MLSASPLPQAAVKSMISHAADLGRANGFVTDYSPMSISAVDKVLNSFYKGYAKEKEHNEEALSGICLSLGIYLGECIRRALPNVPLDWCYGVPQAGGDPTPFLCTQEGTELYVVDWVGKQITGGKHESIAKKYERTIKALGN